MGIFNCRDILKNRYSNIDYEKKKDKKDMCWYS